MNRTIQPGKDNARYRLKRRVSRGSMLLDLPVGAGLTIMLAVAAVDLALFVCGYSFNDAACRDAARAAGTADSSQTALVAATEACSTHRADGLLISQPTIAKSRFHFADEGTSQQPYVSVATTCQVRLPGLSLVYGRNTNDLLPAARNYVFPALSIIQQKATIDIVDINTLVSNNVGLPDTSGCVPGSGTSDVSNSSE